MPRIRPISSQWWLVPLLLLVASQMTLGAAPRNLFNELLGKTKVEIDTKIDTAWQQLFYGNDQDQRVMYPIAGDMAYIADTGNIDVRSEGMSYGMMIAVQLDKRAEFDRLWKWAKTHMYHADGPQRGYFAWQCRYDGTQIDPGSASDGEEWFAMALLFAANRWGKSGGPFDYAAEAQALLDAMRNNNRGDALTALFDQQHHQVVFAPTKEASHFTDPSYHLPAFYELWARWDRTEEGRRFWLECAKESRGFFRRGAHPKTGLMSEYAEFDGTPRPGEKGDFRFDAWRTIANVAVDYAWFGRDPSQVEQANRVLTFLGQQGPNCPNQFALNGRPLSKNPSAGLFAMAAVGALAADQEIGRPFVQRLWDMPVPSGRYRYYDGMLYFLALLQVSGRFEIIGPPPVTVSFDWFTYSGSDDAAPDPLPAGHFQNPILAGFYPDPSICRVGYDYYLINSTFAYFPGIPIAHSRDLVHWEQIGNVIDSPSQADFTGLRVTQGLFAPTIQFHKGVFYILCTNIGKGGNFLVTATNPAGPWSDPQWLGFDGIDPSLFFDDDGRAWVVNNGNPPENKPLYQGHRAIWIQEFDIATRKLVGARSIIVNGGVDLSKKPVWIEGPHLYKRGGWYYLCCAEGGTSTNHSQVILRSKSPTGPFAPWENNPILTQRDLDGNAPGAITATGHADLVEGPDGQWWAVFLACRPFAKGQQLTGRETFLLPVKWTDDGWPLILPKGERVPITLPAPRVATVSPATVPTTGTFTWRDDFDSGQLAPLWLMLRTPCKKWWSFENPRGHITLTPSTETVSGRGNPAFFGRRLQHAKFETATSVSVPSSCGTSAGLVAFQDESHYYYLGVKRTASGLIVFLERANGSVAEIVVQTAIPDSSELELRLRGNGLNGEFAFKSNEGEWQTLISNADLRSITTNAAGGGLHFTGALVGVHTRLEP